MRFASLRAPFSRLSRFARLIIHPSPQSPTITLGPYTGDELSVDHIIANLEPDAAADEPRETKKYERQLDLQQSLRKAGWLL